MPNFKKAARSFTFAIKGIKALFYYENNAQIHLLATIGAVSLGFYVELSNIEWVVLTIQIAAVVAAEAINTAIEKLCDVVSPEHHPIIGSVKDLAAGGVLLMAIAAVITGGILFIPKLISLL